MKIKRLFAAVSAVVTLISMLGTCFVSAEDIENTESTEKIYTFDELLAMSDEEFLSLDGAEFHKYVILSSIKSDLAYLTFDFNFNYDEDIRWGEEYICYIDSNGTVAENQTVTPQINAVFYSLTLDNYTANITEQKISDIFGDTIDYSINSPVNINSNMYYHKMISFELSDYIDVTAKEEDVLLLTKCRYCLNQIIDMTYLGYDMLNFSSAKIITNDVNIDGTVDLYDVIWITKYIAQIYEFPEGQKAVADVSGDGVVNVVDAIMLAEHVNSQEVV